VVHENRRQIQDDRVAVPSRIEDDKVEAQSSSNSRVVEMTIVGSQEGIAILLGGTTLCLREGCLGRWTEEGATDVALALIQRSKTSAGLVQECKITIILLR
jgi:hypothetical protein